jgi:hypothetical protein
MGHRQICKAVLKPVNAGDGDDGGGDARPQTPELQTSTRAVLLQAVSSCVESYHGLIAS